MCEQSTLNSLSSQGKFFFFIIEPEMDGVWVIPKMPSGIFAIALM
jgi:hypothetical protein